MKLTNEEQTKRSLIRTQKRVLELEERIERLEQAIVKLAVRHRDGWLDEWFQRPDRIL